MNKKFNIAIPDDLFKYISELYNNDIYRYGGYGNENENENYNMYKKYGIKKIYYYKNRHITIIFTDNSHQYFSSLDGSHVKTPTDFIFETIKLINRPDSWKGHVWCMEKNCLMYVLLPRYRHHCRNCGKTLCSSHCKNYTIKCWYNWDSSNKHMIDVRLCSGCINEIFTDGLNGYGVSNYNHNSFYKAGIYVMTYEEIDCNIRKQNEKDINQDLSYLYKNMIL